MIKFFKTQDVIVTRFVVAKNQVLDNILLDLILGTEEDSDTYFPIILPIFQCDDIRSGSCQGVFNNKGYLANSGFIDQNIPEFRIGKYVPSSSVFYPSGSIYYNPSTNPINTDGTYKGQVYNSIKKMYYNNSNNSYDQFGFSRLNISNTNLNLTNEFSLYSLSTDQVGDTIRPKSVVLTNQSGDLLTDIYDDGNNNLIVTGSNFINYTEFSSTSQNSIQSYGEYGLSYYLNNIS